MRERLTAAFVASTILIVLAAGSIRAYVVTGEMRERESDFVATQARSIGQVVARQLGEGEKVDEELLSQFVVPGLQLVYEQRDEPTIVLSGPGFVSDAPAESDDPGGSKVVSGTVFTAAGTLTVSRARYEPLSTIWGANIVSTIGLLLLLALISGLVGFVLARSLSRPFRQLALAAAALGRGRFDLDLPASQMPEARAIAQALESSAAQLRERLEREREFGLLASHALRTPLQSLRLHLEDLVGDPTITDDVRGIALRCLSSVGRIGEVAGELVEVSGRGVLVAGAATPLHELATQVSQKWSEKLHDEGRVLTAAVEGDIELLFTPGPVEQALDLVLDEVVRHHAGSVRLVFEGQASMLAVDITCGDRDGRMIAPDEPVDESTAAVLVALGGVVEASRDREALRVLLPRR